MDIDAAHHPRVHVPVRWQSPLAVVFVGLFGAGCLTVSGASRNAIPMVKVQASSDLDCPQRQIRVVQDLGGHFRAFGCGHKVEYNTACDGLSCVVAPEGEAAPWRARPDPNSALAP